MSDVIQGAKSRNYEKSDIPGIQNSGDTLEYVTVQEIGGKRGGLDVVIHGQTRMSTGHIVELGSIKRLIKSTAHGAQKGWIMRPSSGQSQNQEISIVQIIDADSFVISTEFPLSISDTFDLWRFVTPKYSFDGDLSVSSGPVTFIKNSIAIEVEEDTATPANNEPLPSKMFFQKDGLTIPVNKDSGTPANTAAVPVEIVGVSGQVINITAGDINVQTSAEGVNFDSMRIGDGTAKYAGITINDELKVNDADSIALLTTIDADTSLLASTTAAEGATQPSHVLMIGGHNGSGNSRHILVDNAGRQIVNINSSALPLGASTEAKQDDEILSLANILTELELKANLTDTQPVSIAGTVSVSGPLTDAQLRATPVPVSMAGSATEAKQDSQILELSGINSELDSQSLILADLATELTLASLSAKLPSSIGQKAMLDSLSVTIANDQSVIPTSNTPAGTSTFTTQSVSDASVSTFTVPVGAKRMVVYNNADAAGANRIRRGNVANPPSWPSNGPLLGVGSFTSELPATTFTCIAEDSSSVANISVEYFY